MGRLHKTLPSAILVLLTAHLSGCASTAHQTPGTHWKKEGYLWPDGEPHSAHRPGPRPGGDESPSLESRRAKILRQNSLPTPGKTPPSGPVPRVPPPDPVRALLLNDRSCIAELKARNIRFGELSELKGVENPVEIQGPLGGVVFWANDNRPLQLDCRLAIALDRLEPVFAQHGVTRARYSGAYSYRRTKSGRLSHHALGLAIDIHDFEMHGAIVDVKKDFQSHVGCNEENSALNQLTCSMREQAFFEEFLTPDFNRDHRDHLHISAPRRK